MLSRSSHFRTAGIVLVALVTTVTISFPVQGQTKLARRGATLSTGTVIPVKLQDSLSSKDAQKGDAFTATVTTPKENDQATALPVGTKVEGVVEAVQPKDEKNPGTLSLHFNRVTLPDGRSYSISGSPIGLDSKSVTHKNGRLVAKSGRSGPNRLTYVGIGAGAGLLVNILTHRKGTLLDTLVGAGLGYGAGSLIKGGSTVRDVNLASGTKMGVYLERSLALAR